MQELIRALKEKKMQVAERLSARPYNTLRVESELALAVFPRGRNELLIALETVAACGVPYAVVGRGSNLLFPDGIYEGVVIFTTQADAYRMEGDRIYAEAGAPLMALAVSAAHASLSGAEFMGGIPGTLGGAVLTNAGAYGGSLSDLVVSTECWNSQTGCVERLVGEEHRFGYRTSVYAEEPRRILLSAELRLRAGDAREIDRLMRDYRDRRHASQPLELPNAGSVFKHPVGHFAGRLIEECGLKGRCIGGAQVSEKHAGFIVNRGNATEADVLALISLIRSEVMEKKGVRLECELRGLAKDLGSV